MNLDMGVVDDDDWMGVQAKVQEDERDRIASISDVS